MNRRNTPIPPAEADGFDDVLTVLAPLASAYVRRPVPGGQADAADPVLPPSAAVDVAFTPCDVQAVVTVDADGRVPWRHDGPVEEQVVTSIKVVGGTIEVTIEDRHGPGATAFDERGRLRLPRSILRAAGLARGSRVVIARTGAHRMLVVSTDRLGVWTRAA